MQDLTPEQKATNAETWQHIDSVMRLLGRMQYELMKRQFTHDRSKLAAPEVDTFTEYTPKLATSTYGSDEYKQFLVEMKPALDHHYSHNRHHPEYFADVPKDEDAIARCDDSIKFLGYAARNPYMPDDVFAYERCIEAIEARKKELESNVNGMNLIDLLEMLVDWKAAGMRHNDGDIHKSIEINTKRFGLSPQLVAILKNTVPLLEDPFAGLSTQKDIQNP